MGYTHYWKPKGKVNEEQYAKAIEDIKVIVKRCAPVLANWAGDFGTSPEFETAIRFNGIDYTSQIADEGKKGDHSHETFSLPLTPPSESNCCKTARKPYDHVVVACLAVLAEVEGMDVQSDGYKAEWEDGVALATAALGRPVAIPSTIDAE